MMDTQVFGLTGANGRVGSGALEILDACGAKKIEMGDLEKTWKEKPKGVYYAFIEPKHMVQNSEGLPFNKDHYYEKPHEFSPIFHSEYLKHFSVLVNNMFWDYKYQRLITCE